MAFSTCEGNGRSQADKVKERKQAIGQSDMLCKQLRV